MDRFLRSNWDHCSHVSTIRKTYLMLKNSVWTGGWAPGAWAEMRSKKCMWGGGGGENSRYQEFSTTNGLLLAVITGRRYINRTRLPTVVTFLLAIRLLDRRASWKLGVLWRRETSRGHDSKFRTFVWEMWRCSPTLMHMCYGVSISFAAD
jgi:hypothetical protein